MYVNAKIIPVQSIPGMEEGGGIKGVWIQAWSIWYIVRTFVNATMNSHPAWQ
jgi:hypothetical protein